MLNLGKLSVELVDSMGNDLRVVNSARISLSSSSDRLDEKDVKLIKYLARHKHYTPFEHCVVSMIINCPLYIRSQIHRHRVFSYNEVSRRYTNKGISFYVPDKFGRQQGTNKQKGQRVFDSDTTEQLRNMYIDSIRQSYEVHRKMLMMGVSREDARATLPNCLMTSFYMTGSLRNWADFIRLRAADDAQSEVQEIANMCLQNLGNIAPVSIEALLDG